MIEEWRAIPGFEGFYEVSDQGRVRGLDRIIDAKDRFGNPCRRRVQARILRPGRRPSGHVTVALCGNSRNVHELVLTTFKGERPPKMEARHLNGKEYDNRLDNLKWDTKANNMRDRKWHKGTDRRNNIYKLAPGDMSFIKLSLKYRSVKKKELCRIFGVCSTTIENIRNEKVGADVYIK